MKPSVRRPLVGLLSTLSLGGLAAACGLSFDIPSIPDPVASPDAEVAPVDARVADTSVPDVSSEDADVPDASTPDADASAMDAGRDATVDATADAGGCTTLLKEDFSSGLGTKLTLLGDPALTKVVNQKVQLLPDDPNATQKAGAAFFNPPADVFDFNATFVITTGMLTTNVYDTADGFAFSWLEKAVPATANLRAGNDLGMTLEPGGQRGFAAVLDIYPEATSDRYFSLNELAGNNVRTSAAGGPFGTLVGSGKATLRYKVTRRGNVYTFAIDRSGLMGMTASTGVLTKTATLGAANAPTRGFVFSSASGGAHSPGFFVDDVEIQSCP